jgi:fumarate reductase flavoprotein subunit
MRIRDGFFDVPRYGSLLLPAGFLVLLLGLAGPVLSQKVPETGTFLADRHKTAGIECGGCHKENPPAQAVPAAVCLGCHTDITKAGETGGGQPNPHRAHMSYPECGSCHHSHKLSEDQCGNCHNFGYETP